MKFGRVQDSNSAKLSQRPASAGTGSAFAKCVLDAELNLSQKLSTTRTEITAATLPPVSNTGEKFKIQQMLQVQMQGGQPKPVIAPAIRIAGEICNIDWLNVVLPRSFFKFDINTDDKLEYVEARQELDSFLTRIFGTWVTEEKPGRNFYSHSLVIGESWGYVLHGGQRGTVCLMLSGTGCTTVKSGWEQRLFAECSKVPGAKITRVDLAHDDFTGSRGTIQDIDTIEETGGFTWEGHQRSEVTHAGNWKHSDPRNKGLTLYVGSTSSGKRLCCYEKGKQLGDADSKWIRYEVRFSNKDRILPWTILLNPSHFFASSYPCFESFSDKKERIEIKKKAASITYAAGKRTLTRQYGQYINMIIETEGIEALRECIREGVPKRIRQFTTSSNTQPGRLAA